MMPAPVGWMKWPFTGLTPRLIIGCVLTAAVFWAATGSTGHLILGYAILVVVQLRPFTWMFGGENATEFILMMGHDRRTMANRYLREVLLISLAHSIVIFGVWWLAESGEYPRFGLTRPWLEAKVLVCLLSVQVLVRSWWLSIMHLPFATCLPSRLRAGFLFPMSFAGFTVGILLTVSVFLAGAVLTLAPLAAGSFVTLAILARSSEFSGRSAAWRLPVQADKRALPQLRGSWSPFAALLLKGLSRWVWGSLILFLVPAGVAGAVVIFLPSRVIEMESPVLFFLVLGVEAWFVLLMWLGRKIFRWSAVGPSAEFLHMAGLDIAGLRRIKLLTGALILLAAAAVGYAVLNIVAETRTSAEKLNWVLKSAGFFCIVAGAGYLLLSTNECPVASRRGKPLLGSDFAWLLWGATCLMLVAALGVEVFAGSRLKNYPFPWAMAGGLVLFIPAAVLWLIGWSRASDESSGRD